MAIKIEDFTPEEVAQMTPTAGSITHAPFEFEGVGASDVGKALASGFTMLGEGIGGVGEYLNVPGGAKLAEASREGGEFWRESMGPAAKHAMSREFARTDDKAAWRNLDSMILQMAQIVPMTAATMGPVGLAARAGATGGKLAAIGAGTEGALGGGLTQSQISSEVDKLSDKDLKALATKNKIPADVDVETLRQAVKDRVSRWVVPTVASVSGALGGVIAPIQGALFVPKNLAIFNKTLAATGSKKKAAQAMLDAGDGTVKAWAKDVGKNTALEAVQEALQEGTEHIGGQVALDRPVTQGLGEAMAAGAVLGAGMAAPATAVRGASLPPDVRAAAEALKEEQRQAPPEEPPVPPAPPRTPGVPPTGPGEQITGIPPIGDLEQRQTSEQNQYEINQKMARPPVQPAVPVEPTEPPKQYPPGKQPAPEEMAPIDYVEPQKPAEPAKPAPPKDDKNLTKLNAELEKIEVPPEEVAAKVAATPKRSTKVTGAVSEILNNPKSTLKQYRFNSKSDAGAGSFQYDTGKKGKGKWANIGKEGGVDRKQDFINDVHGVVQATVAEMNALAKQGADITEIKKLLQTVAYAKKEAGQTKETASTNWETKGQLKTAQGNRFNARAVNNFLKNIQRVTAKAAKGKKAAVIAPKTKATETKVAEAKVRAEKEQAQKTQQAAKEKKAKSEQEKKQRQDARAKAERAIKEKYDDESVTHGDQTRGTPPPAVRSNTNVSNLSRNILSVITGTQNYLDSDLAKALGVESMPEIGRKSRAYLQKMIAGKPIKNLEPEEIALKNRLYDKYVELSEAGAKSGKSIPQQFQDIVTADRKVAAKIRKEAGLPEKGESQKATFEIKKATFGRKAESFLKRLKAKYTKDFDTKEAFDQWMNGPNGLASYMRDAAEGNATPDQIKLRLQKVEGLTDKEVATALDIVLSFRERVDQQTPAAQEQTAKERAIAEAEAWLESGDATEAGFLAAAELIAAEEAGMDTEQALTDLTAEEMADTGLTGFNYTQDDAGTIEDLNDYEYAQAYNKTTGKLEDMLDENYATPEVREGRKRAYSHLRDMVNDNTMGTVGTSELAMQMAVRLHPSDPLVAIFGAVSRLKLTDKVSVGAISGNPQSTGVFEQEYKFSRRRKWLRTMLGKITLKDDKFYAAHLLEMASGDASASQAEIVRVLAHEMVHASSSLVIQANTEAGVELEFIRKYVKTYLKAERGMTQEGIENIYGLRNSEEFLAEALTNPWLQDVLNNIEYPGQPTGKRASLWDYLVKAIGKMLGVPVSDNSTLAAVIRLTPELLMTRRSQVLTYQIAQAENAMGDREFMDYETRYNIDKLKGKDISYEVQTEDTGETFTVTEDAGEAIADISNRLSALEQLRACVS